MNKKTAEDWKNEKVYMDFKPGAVTKKMMVDIEGFSMTFENGAGPFEAPRWVAKQLKKLGFVEVSC